MPMQVLPSTVFVTPPFTLDESWLFPEEEEEEEEALGWTLGIPAFFLSPI